MVEPQAYRSKRACISSSPRPGQLPWHPVCHPTHHGKASACPKREYSHHASFAALRDAQCLHASTGQLMNEAAYALQSHIVMVKIKAHREVGVGGLQMQVGLAVDSSLQLGGIILTNLGAHGCLAMRS